MVWSSGQTCYFLDKVCYNFSIGCALCTVSRLVKYLKKNWFWLHFSIFTWLTYLKGIDLASSLEPVLTLDVSPLMQTNKQTNVYFFLNPNSQFWPWGLALKPNWRSGRTIFISPALVTEIFPISKLYYMHLLLYRSFFWST